MASCCISSDMSAFLITAFRSDAIAALCIVTTINLINIPIINLLHHSRHRISQPNSDTSARQISLSIQWNSYVSKLQRIPIFPRVRKNISAQIEAEEEKEMNRT